MERFEGSFFEQLLPELFATDLSCLSRDGIISFSSLLQEDMAVLLRQSLMAADAVRDVLQLCIETVLDFPGIAWGAGYVVDEKSTALDLAADRSEEHTSELQSH